MDTIEFFNQIVDSGESIKIVQNAVSEAKAKQYYEPTHSSFQGMSFWERLVFEKGQKNANYEASELAQKACEIMLRDLTIISHKWETETEEQ